MGDSGGAPGFGQIDLELEDDPDTLVRHQAPTKSSSGPVAVDVGEPDEPPSPPSTSRVFPAEKRATRKHISVNDESTRVISGDALSVLTRPPPPLEDDGSTRAWADVDEALLSVGEDAAPTSVRSGSRPAPSGAGAATPIDRVAAMRELYAKGDAEGALALAATLGPSAVLAHGTDYPDASIIVEFGEQSIDVSNPFGGLIAMDDELVAKPSAPPPAPVCSTPPGAHLTLTERQSIPRLLKSMGEISKLKIDHRAGFLLAHVDGMQTLEEILDVCAMPSTEALAMIANLKKMGVIEFE